MTGVKNLLLDNYIIFYKIYL